MESAETATEEAPDAVTEQRPKRSPKSLANLRPPFQKGVSRNPGGIPKDGKPKNPLPSQLRARFIEAWATGDVSQRFIARWLKDAISGPPSLRAKARDQVLERFWPVIEESVSQQRTVQLGVRLELGPGQTPTLTAIVGETTQPLPAPIPVMDAPSSSDGESVALVDG